MEPVKNIEELIQEGEGYLVEFKESPQGLEKEICAFTNASGGIIYIGITDDGKIKSIDLTNRLRSQIMSSARSCDPAPTIDICKVDEVIAVCVAESQSKPVRAPTGFYLRIGATSQKLTRDEIFSFAVRESRILFDNQLFVEETADEFLSIRAVEVFREKAKLDVDLDNINLLQNLRCLKYQNNKPYLTNAGALLFGKDPRRYFPHVSMTMLHMEDPSTILEQKIIGGTLFEQVEAAYLFLKSRLRSKPRIEGLRREDVLEFPEGALREMLVNAVIHRDYFERSADVMVKIFPGYLEISNPGIVSNTLSLDALFGRSFRRNPMIADMFFHANYIERAGTGLLRVKKALEDSNLPPLRLSEEGPFFIATLTRRAGARLDEDLNLRQQELLSLSKDFFPFSTLEYSKRFKISERMARLDIQSLVKHGLLVPMKEGRRTRYDRA